MEQTNFGLISHICSGSWALTPDKRIEGLVTDKVPMILINSVSGRAANCKTKAPLTNGWQGCSPTIFPFAIALRERHRMSDHPVKIGAD